MKEIHRKKRKLNKRIWAWLLALTMVIGLAGGCASEAESPQPQGAAPEQSAEAAPQSSGEEPSGSAGYNPGTYTGVGTGMNGEVSLEVTFSETGIVEIQVGSHSETAGIADPAFERIPAAIIDNQSLSIDTVSGCTMTSNAILEAVAQAVGLAGGDVQALKDKAVTTEGPGDTVELSADVIVVGGGGAGIAAAASAAEHGATVILVEKTAALGGNTLASGLAMNAADPEVQSGMEAISGQEETLRAVLDYDASGFGDYGDILTTLQDQITAYLEGGAAHIFDSVEWHIIQSYEGGRRTDKNGNLVENNFDLLTMMCENSLESFHWLGEVLGVPLSGTITSPVGSMWRRGHNLETKLDLFTYGQDYITGREGQVVLETRIEELIVEDGAVAGARGTQINGTPVVLRANKGVILTTGGFGANSEMVAEYNTYWPDIPPGIKTTCVAAATGDGIALGQQAGANLVDMGMIQLMPTAGAETGSLTDGLLVAPQNYLFVNKEGVRFVNEYAERDVLAFAALEQTDGMFFTIADQEMAKTVQNGATQEEIDAMVDKGLIYKADTIAGLADQIGCAPETLEATIAGYNACVDTGSDPDFGKSAFEMKVETGPFYACPSRPSVHHTMGGLEINTSAQVLDGDGQVIPGLYAAGEVTGGIHAGNRLGGNAIADCIVFGRAAGREAATAN